MIIDPKELKLGTETYKYNKGDQVSQCGHHLVMLRALNTTNYRYTTIPPALKNFKITAQKR